MKIILAPPFSRASLNSTALAPQQAAALHLEFLAINSVFERHRRRLNRAAAVGETLDMSFDRACAARDVRMYHARPFPVDEALVGIHDVLLFAEVAASTLIDPAAYLAAWRFTNDTEIDLAALAIYTEVPEKKLVFYWRGLWAEAQTRLSKLAVNEVEFAHLITRAQAAKANAA